MTLWYNPCQRMDQLRQYLRGLEKARFHTHTDSTPKPKQSMCHYLLTCIFDPKNNRAEMVWWVAESVRPFEIVKDRGFQSLMKTGHPEYYIPSPSTVSRDVWMVFSKTRQRIAKLLRVSKTICPKIWNLTKKKEYDGALNFATDAWTSPNHRAFVAVTVHLEQDGAPPCLVLDVVEVAEVWYHEPGLSHILNVTTVVSLRT